MNVHKKSHLKKLVSRKTNVASDNQKVPANNRTLIISPRVLGRHRSCRSNFDGSYVLPDGIDIYTAKLIHELQMPEIVRRHGIEIPTISTKDHIEGWKKQKEGTSSEPEALSFSH